MSEFSEDAFRARVKARCAELGRSVRSILIEANLAHDVIDKVPAHGRRIDTLEKLAAPLGWSLREIMGFDEPRLTRIDQELMRDVFKVVRRAWRNVPDPDEIAPDAITMTYNTLLGLRADGVAVDTDTFATIERLLAETWGSAARRG